MENGNKHLMGIDVLTASRERIAWTFNNFPRIYVSFSGGKDSTVMLHLVMDEAIRARKKGWRLVRGPGGAVQNHHRSRAAML